MAKRNTNPGGGKDDNEMRIQFGLILALCQNCAISHNPVFHAQNSNLFKGLPPMFPDVSPMFSAPGVSATRRYVKHVALEGKVVQGNFLKASDLANGGDPAIWRGGRPEGAC